MTVNTWARVVISLNFTPVTSEAFHVIYLVHVYGLFEGVEHEVLLDCIC